MIGPKSAIAIVLILATAVWSEVSPDETCGVDKAGNKKGYTCPGTIKCCSASGYCGATDEYCLTTAGCQDKYSNATGSCIKPVDGVSISPDGTCGSEGAGKYGYHCPTEGGTCCSVALYTMTTLFHNGRFFQSAPGGKDPSFADSLLIDESGRITHIGSISDEQIKTAESSGGGVVKHDMRSRIILPGFIDGHMHLLMLGQSLQKAGLEACKNLQDIRQTIKEFAASHPSVVRIMCKGWMHSMTNGEALASMIDDLDPRPIFIDSKDLHSTWCNTAALDEMGVQDMPDPEGGKIHRDENGKASGLLSEAAAVTIVWPHIAKVAPMEEKLAALRGAVKAYNASGYTGLVEMAMDENAWEALQVLRQTEDLSIRIAVHWLITPRKTEAENLAQVDRAIELNRQFNADTSPDCRIVGIKVIGDGIIDGCTAGLSEPYSLNGVSCEPIWSLAELGPVVRKADAAGLQCALHAIGDKTIRVAIDALEQNATPGRRHRIEHLELASPEDAIRLGKLGITASIQPVHADPAILRVWPSLLGPSRCERAFAYKEFADGGAVLALGSDAPTAPHAPLRNAYTATTRRSAREPELTDRMNPHFALELAAAIAAGTEGSAYSCFADQWAGKLETGREADFVVVDMDWDANKLLEAKVVQTWFKGMKIFDVGA
ncbi:amidohydrolase family-domain-containing protein [Hypoxylon trugodes]|uniref:amidohydrolase family-domain-containing protein n=1 Tax=Hypoxylon trugodes TaxID=326681 RepID=UPI00218F1AAA|nr:amidohydrolase family-domain-containing protein [Hypoxylon trugodes]KAI1388098.1 amidohydrolase family-domain-containing protein [Hypoxylon trugodes]